MLNKTSNRKYFERKTRKSGIMDFFSHITLISCKYIDYWLGLRCTKPRNHN